MVISPFLLSHSNLRYVYWLESQFECWRFWFQPVVAVCRIHKKRIGHNRIGIVNIFTPAIHLYPIRERNILDYQGIVVAFFEKQVVVAIHQYLAEMLPLSQVENRS